jgi:hypothetical protein
MLQNLFIATASAFALSAGMAGASEYMDGLRTGGAIVTCSFLESGEFRDESFGSRVLREQFKQLTSIERSHLVQLWLDDEDDKCIRAVR